MGNVLKKDASSDISVGSRYEVPLRGSNEKLEKIRLKKEKQRIKEELKEQKQRDKLYWKFLEARFPKRMSIPLDY